MGCNVRLVHIFYTINNVLRVAGVCYFWPSICSNTLATNTEPTTDVPDFYGEYEEYDFDYDSYVNDSDV